ncbi:ACP phosphodiesterase [Salinicola halophilus]|uniref:acyl carrier protein phosphodiesterase n=1 Tax=Salinicola halophilus TaxID=184065 RepID=UPI000DA229D3|nr:ACP phosphodiesterase [Salinicola halophilus]
MNFLAHAWLARHGNDDFLYGNLIADGIKGSDFASLGEDIAAGVSHHRQVDAAIDSHPAVAERRAAAPSGQRRYTGIALDLVWDHFIARDMPDDALVTRCYAILGRRPAPDRLGEMMPALIRGDWLSRYADFDFTCRAIAGIGSRLRGPNQLAALTPWLESTYPELEAAFRLLWPQMQARFTPNRASTRPH